MVITLCLAIRHSVLSSAPCASQEAPLSDPSFRLKEALGFLIRSSSVLGANWRSATPVAHRLELLAFYELQFTPMAAMKIPEVEAFVKSHLLESQFERVWVFDAENRSVLFSCDLSALK